MRRVTYAPKTLVKVPNIFGDGSSGAVVYTVDTTLGGDVLATTITVNAGVTLYTNGYRLFATLRIVNNGTISCQGLPSTLAALWIGGFGAPYGTLPGGSSGGCSFYTDISGTTGQSQDGSPALSAYQIGCGRGGDGGVGASPSHEGVGSGHDASYGTGVPSINVVDAIHVTQGRYSDDGINQFGASGGGGCGGGGSGNAKGGPGGGGGGVILLSSPIVKNVGTITAKGGAGIEGDVLNLASWACGGGGGGGGGCILLIGDIITLGTTDVTGGAGGLGKHGGANGTAGASGAVIQLRSQ